MKEQWGMDWDGLVDVCFKIEELNSIIHYVRATFFRNNQHATINLEFKLQICNNGLILKTLKIATDQEVTGKKNYYNK